MKTEQISEAVKRHYWGEDWSGEFPKWASLEPYQQEELLELESLIHQAVLSELEALAEYEIKENKTDPIFTAIRARLTELAEEKDR